MRLSNNQLLRSDKKWSLSIPYTEIKFNYLITKNLLFESEFDISYKRDALDFKLEDLFLEYTEESFFLPFSFLWGYFRVDYIESNSPLLNKKTLVEQYLFPYGNRALGVLIKTDFNQFISLMLGLQGRHYKRETDSFYSLQPAPALSGHLLYSYKNQKLFTGYFQQNLFLEGSLSALGLGADLNAFYKDWTFKLKTEAWKIHKTQPYSQITSYYFFPFLKWKSFIGAGFLAGAVQEEVLNNKGFQFERIVQLNFYFTKNSHLSIENIKEYSTIFTKNSWNFSIKTEFAIQ